MIKIIYRSIILLIFLIIFLVTYLSVFGIKTDKFNKQISQQIQNFNKELEIELKEVNIILDPFNFRFLIKTIGTDLKFKNKKIKFERIKSEISIKSLLNGQFSMSQLDISTNSINIKDFISFVRVLNDDPKLYFVEKIIKDGYLIADLELEFDEDGAIKENFKINGIVNNGKINFLKKYNLSKINFNFYLTSNIFEFNDVKLLLNEKNLSIPKAKVQKKKNEFFVSGKINNKDIELNKDEIKKFVGLDFTNLDIDQIKFQSENEFSFKINKNFKLKDFELISKINLKKFIIFDEDLKKLIPQIEKKIIFENHLVNLDYKKNSLKIKGSGDFFIQEKDKIEYEISKKDKNYRVKSFIKISNNQFNLDFLNYEKKKNTKLNIDLILDINDKNHLFFENISLIENDNQFQIKKLSLEEDFLINGFQMIILNYLDKDNIKNKITIKNNNNNYSINGEIFNADKILKNILETDNDDLKLFNKDFNINIDVKKVHLDIENFIKDFNGDISFKNNLIHNANLSSNFSNNKQIKFTIKTNDNEKITTLFTGEAKPLVDRYKFIKGFKEGSLDFYSTKKKGITYSTLKIYDFKLKELPALTKLLTLASLQGIADLLSGEGIRFNEFEMNFSNKGDLMTIEEIYAIGPAISILMNGYVEKDKLISLRGTLVPATTLNKTIGSIPFLGDILVGKKTGEGVFGVSFKIKGPPKKLETSVNPIKTLTPRFITRTLEKIKKN